MGSAMRAAVFAALALTPASQAPLAAAGDVEFIVPPVPTRHGELTGSADGVLLFRGRPVAPEVAYDGSAFTSPVATFAIGAADVLLFMQAHGNACPGAFAFVTVTADGARSSGEFGTCWDDHSEPELKDGVVSFTQPGLDEVGTYRFEYRDGQVLQDGKPVVPRTGR